MTTQQIKRQPEGTYLDQNQWKLAVTAIVIAQCIFGLMCVFQVPLWMPSDERAHMRYIMDLAATGHLHIMRIGDPSYETHQPPLFYAIGALLYLLMPSGSLVVKGMILRIFCLALYVCSTFFTADILRRHLPGQLFLAIAALAFFALSPSLLAVNATISNDALSFLLAVLAAWIISRYNFTVPNWRVALALGVVIGLGMFCKLTQFPVLLAILLYTVFRNKRNWPHKLWLATCELAPTLLLLIPWLLWNHSVYGTWTATSRLYGMAAAYAQHPHPVRNLHDFNIASILDYHYLPTEFWLNQFKVPSPLKLELIGLTLLSLVGLFLLIPKMKQLEGGYRNLLGFCTVFYLCHFLTFLGLDVVFTAGPVRWIFGSFFAVSLLWSAGIDSLTQSIMNRNGPAIILVVSVAFTVLNNCYLLAVQVPKLQGYGLHP